MNELKHLYERFILFEEQGRIRQPLVRYLSLYPYSMTDPGKYREYYLHREIIDGQEKYYQVRAQLPSCRTSPTRFKEPPTDDRLAIVYSPIEKISFLYPHPFQTRVALWKAFLVELTWMVSGEPLTRTAMLRVEPKDRWILDASFPGCDICEDTRHFRYQDEDNAPDHVVIWR